MSTFRQKIRAFRENAMHLPQPARIAVGLLFVLFGLVGFLPILGFWMVPVGLAILAIDIPIVKKLVLRITTAFNQWRRKRRGANGA